MTRHKSLIELRDKVKAGGIVQPFLFQDVFNDQQLHENCAGEAYEAYRDSLDAAKALHEEAVSQWLVCTIQQLENGRWYVQLYRPMGEDWPKWTPYPSVEAASDTPARAWLLAILEALIAQETQP